jgi:predicted ABC-type ATPase
MPLQRIRDRVLLGGHDVPESDVRRRYARGLRKLRQAVERANDVVLYDNSETSGFTLVAFSNETELLAVRPPPAWVGKAMITVTLTQFYQS